MSQNRSSGSQSEATISAYLKGLGRTPLLTRKEEVKLFQRIEAGGQDAERAKLELANANLRLVVSIAKRYLGQSKNLNVLHLIQEGNLGLMKAVEGHFDWRMGYKFSTYATPGIKRAVEDALRRDRHPVVKNSWADSLDAPISGDGDSEDSVYDLTEDKTVVLSDVAADKGFLKETVMGALSVLTEREKRVVSMHFGLENGRALTLDQTGEKFGVTRERIRHILARSFYKIRKHKDSDKLKRLVGI